MGDLGFGELVLIVIIAILLYGKDLPQVARKLAHYYSKLRRHLNDIKDEISRQIPSEEISVDTSSNPSPYSSGGAPSPPTGLLASLDQNQVILTWDVESQAEYYNVKRSTPPEGSYASIATGLSSTTYTDTPTFDGSTVSYVVTATNTYGESGDSMEATILLPAAGDPAPPPAPAGATAEAAPPAPAAAEAAPTAGPGNGNPEAAPAPSPEAAPGDSAPPRMS